MYIGSTGSSTLREASTTLATAFAEMFCDRVAASRVYLREKYSDASPYEYFLKGLPDQMMHPDTIRELEKMLLVLKDEGEDEAIRYVCERLKQSKVEKTY